MTISIVGNKRIPWLDSLKGLLIISVVLGHCIQYSITNYSDVLLFRYIYSFHMAMFVFVSGYVCYRPVLEWSIIYRRAKQLLLPFLVWSIVMCIIRRDFQLWDMVLQPEKSFWFLWVLFFITLFHVFAYRLTMVLKWKDEWGSFMLGAFLLGFTAFMRTKVFGLQMIAFYYMFYLLGFYSHKYNIVEKVPRQLRILALISWAVMAWFWSSGRPIHQLQYNNPILTVAYHFSTALFAIIAFVPAMRSSNTESRFLCELGRATLAIYVIHLSLLSILPSSSQLTFLYAIPEWLFISLLTFLCLVMSYVIYCLMRMSKVLSFIFFGK